MRVRAKPVKSIGPLKAAERLLGVIESFARLILNKRSVDCDDVNNIWFVTVKLVLRLCALRLAYEDESWKSLLLRSEEFLGCPDLNFSDSDAEFLPVLSSLDGVIGGVNCERLEQTISVVYEMVLNMVPKLIVDESGANFLVLKQIEKLKKRSGSFYSPTHLVEKTVEKALAPLIVDDELTGAFKPLSEILELKILDPAMGAGVFLIQAYRYLINNVPSSKEEKLQIARQCLFGVDLDPLAVEVARLGLWLTVKDQTLDPAQNLDPVRDFPNLRIGNSLIGGRIDQCEGFENVSGANGTDYVSEESRLNRASGTDCVSEDSRGNRANGTDYISEESRGDRVNGTDYISEENRGDRANGTDYVSEESRGDRANRTDYIKNRLDRWCAKWFLPQDLYCAGVSPDEKQFSAIARSSKFFHWEIEYPEVFERNVRENPGFDAVVGNPPWEISKPNSREFFGMVDPNYWGLGKQDALAVQQRLLASDPALSLSWTSIQHQHRLFARWVKNAPVQLDRSVHAFACQGSGDLNLYKLFCEQSFYLAREGGSIALIVPSGLYSDSGARDLRRLLLEKNNWVHLSGFDNSDSAFDIHRSFKYCIFVARKAGKTSQIKTSFLGQPCEYSASIIAGLSPKWLVLSEVESKAALSLLERIYDNSQLLGSAEYGGCRIEYAREFDMTIDSQRFHQREKLESQSCLQDVYGNWLSGKWRSHNNGNNTASGAIVSACGSEAIAIEDVVDVYVPLYEGRMVGQFTANDKHWVSGKGRRAVWEQGSGDGLGPQYLIHKDAYDERDARHELKVGFLAVGCATNARTMIASCLSAVACGNSVPVLRLKTADRLTVDLRTNFANVEYTAIENDYGKALGQIMLKEEAHEKLSSDELQLVLSGCLNSFVFDFVIRRKMAGNNLNYFVIEECPLPKLTDSNLPIFRRIANLVAQLNFGHLRFSRELHRLGYTRILSISSNSAHFRVLRAYIDVLVAHLYGLNHQDLSVILSDEMLSSGKVNTKGFFRIDRHLQMEDRLPVLVLKHAAELEKIGVSSMLQRIETVVDFEWMRSNQDRDITHGDISIYAQVLDEILNLRFRH